MIAWEIYALINNNEVKNVVIGDYYNCNNVAVQNYGNGSFAIEVTQIPTQIGDIYENGMFKRYNVTLHDYEIIEPLPTDKDQINSLIIERDTLNGLITDIQIALVELAEEL